MNIASAQLSKPRSIDDLRYGEKGDKTITVIIGGDIAKPGTYYLPKGFGLKSILGLAAGYAWSHHRSHGNPSRAQFQGSIDIIRKTTPKKKQRIEISSLQKASSQDIELKDGDIIHFVPIRIYEK